MDQAYAGDGMHARKPAEGRTVLGGVLSERGTLAAIALLPILFVAAMALCKLNGRLYYFLAREDGLAEWATAVAYVAACGVASLLASRLARAGERIFAALYALLAAGFFVIAMEEISWGQRLFGFATPQVIEHLNAQGEMTLHNMRAIPLHEAYIFVCLYGAFARLIAWPLLAWRGGSRLIERVTAPPTLFLYFAIPLAYYGYTEVLYHTEVLPSGLGWAEWWTAHPSFINGQDQEPLELLLAGGFLLFVLLAWSRMPTHRAA